MKDVRIGFATLTVGATWFHAWAWRWYNDAPVYQLGPLFCLAVVWNIVGVTAIVTERRKRNT